MLKNRRDGLHCISLFAPPDTLFTHVQQPQPGDTNFHGSITSTDSSASSFLLSVSLWIVVPPLRTHPPRKPSLVPGALWVLPGGDRSLFLLTTGCFSIPIASLASVRTHPGIAFSGTHSRVCFLFPNEVLTDSTFLTTHN